MLQINYDLSAGLRQELKQTLLKCDTFASHESLLAVFTDSRIATWRDEVPETKTRADRVEQTIAKLFDQSNNKGENALSLFLSVLQDAISEGDALHNWLHQLSVRLAEEHRNGLMKAYENEIQRLEGELAAHTQMYEREKRRAEELISLMATYEKEKQRLEKELERLKPFEEKLQQTAAQLATLMADVAESEKRHAEELESLTATHKSEKQRLEGEKQRLEKELERLKSLEEKLQQTEEQLTTLRNEKQQVAEQLNSLQDKYSDLERLKNASEEKFQQTEKQLTALRDEKQQVAEQLRALQAQYVKDIQQMKRRVWLGLIVILVIAVIAAVLVWNFWPREVKVSFASIAYTVNNDAPALLDLRPNTTAGLGAQPGDIITFPEIWYRAEANSDIKLSIEAHYMKAGEVMPGTYHGRTIYSIEEGINLFEATSPLSSTVPDDADAFVILLFHEATKLDGRIWPLRGPQNAALIPRSDTILWPFEHSTLVDFEETELALGTWTSDRGQLIHATSQAFNGQQALQITVPVTSGAPLQGFAGWPHEFEADMIVLHYFIPSQPDVSIAYIQFCVAGNQWHCECNLNPVYANSPEHWDRWETVTLGLTKCPTDTTPFSQQTLGNFVVQGVVQAKDTAAPTSFTMYLDALQFFKDDAH